LKEIILENNIFEKKALDFVILPKNGKFNPNKQRDPTKKKK